MKSALIESANVLGDFLIHNLEKMLLPYFAHEFVDAIGNYVRRLRDDRMQVNNLKLPTFNVLLSKINLNLIKFFS